ncbi:MAG TPA: hypothetical protein VN041_13450 [Microbacterium sp.]|nr:hypothetical protein [Microbacterium sp.]
MPAPRPLPESLGRRFSVASAVEAGVGRGRLRRADLEAPFHSVRARRIETALDDLDPYTKQVTERRIQADNYAPRLRADHCLSHESAVAIWGGPLPLVLPPLTDPEWRTPGADRRPRQPVSGLLLDVDVSTLGDGPLVRARGVRGHRADPAVVSLRKVRGFLVASPATAWAQLGHLSLLDLVALGDHFCRRWRDGHGRSNAGRRPLATVDELREKIASTRWRGIRRLREAVDLVREDSWSPRESHVRCHLVLSGLPEPVLNHDAYDRHGAFLGCVDLAYPERRVAIEYQGLLHSAQYAADVERIAALRAAGWTVIEVTSELLARPSLLIARVRAALQS